MNLVELTGRKDFFSEENIHRLEKLTAPKIGKRLPKINLNLPQFLILNEIENELFCLNN